MKKKALTMLVIASILSTTLVGCGDEAIVENNSIVEKTPEPTIKEESTSIDSPISIIVDGKVDGYNNNVKEENSKSSQGTQSDKQDSNQTTITKQLILAIQENQNNYSSIINFGYDGAYASTTEESAKFSNYVELSYVTNSFGYKYLSGIGKFKVDGSLSDSSLDYFIDKYYVDGKFYSIEKEKSTNTKRWQITSNKETLGVVINRDELSNYLNKSNMSEENGEYVFNIDSPVSTFFTIFDMGPLNKVFTDKDLLSQNVSYQLYIDKNTKLPKKVVFNKSFNYTEMSINHASALSMSSDYEKIGSLKNMALTKIAISIDFDFSYQDIYLDEATRYEAEHGLIANNFEYTIGMTKYDFKYIYNNKYQNDILMTFDSSSTNAITATGFDSGLEAEFYMGEKNTNAKYLGKLSIIGVEDLKHKYGYEVSNADRINIPTMDIYTFEKSRVVYAYIKIDENVGLIFSNNGTNIDLQNLSAIIEYLN